MQTNKLLTLIVLPLLLFMIGSRNAAAESIVAFPQVRTMNDTMQYNWLVANKYEISKDSILSQMKIWATEKEKQKEWHDYLFLENEIANLIAYKRKYDQGLERLERASSLFAEHNDTLQIEYAYTHYMFSILHWGDRYKYITAYEHCIGILKAIDHHSTFYTNCLFFLGSSYYAGGYTDKTIQILRELEQESEFKPIIRIHTDGLAASLFAEMQPNYAVEITKKIIADIDSLNNRGYRSYQGAYTIRLGRYYGRAAYPEKENECYHQAIKLFTGSRDYVNLANCYQNLALSHIKVGKFDEAMPYLAAADSIAKANNHARLKYKVIEIYGYLYENQGQIDSALAYYQKAEAMVKAGKYGSLDRLADLNAGMAKLYMQNKEDEKALYHATKSINIYNRDQEVEPTQTPQPLRTINEANIELKVIKPLLYYTQLLAKRESKDARPYVYHAEKYADTIFTNSMNYVIENDVILGAREYALPAYNIALELKVADYFATKDADMGFKALSTADGLKSSFLLFEKRALKSSYLNNDSLDSQISALEMKSKSGSTAKDSVFCQLQITKLRSEKFKNNMSLLLKDEGELVRIPKLNKSLMQEIPAETSLVEYHLADSTLYTFVIDHKTIEIVKTVINTNLQKLTKKALREVKTGSKQSSALDQLSHLLIAPIQSMLKDKVVIIPDESFSLFTLECLKVNDRFLIENHSISYSYSINLWLENKSSQTNKDYSALAIAPTFGKGDNNLLAEYRACNVDSTNTIFRGDELEELPYSRREVNEIYKLFNKNNLSCAKYLGTMATEANVRQAFNDYSILHLATHGLVSKSDESQTGLFLANVDDSHSYENDGFLSMKELFNIDVSADLVVLSACKTAYGRVQRTEGIISLPRSFIYAGVPNIIASLWKVQDKNTAYLMERFYHHLLNKKEPYASALRQAKVDCIAQGQLAMDWSSFILIGE